MNLKNLSRLPLLLALLLASLGVNLSAQTEEKDPTSPEGRFDPSLYEFVKRFKSLGEGVHGAGERVGPSPQESIDLFELSEGLEIEVIASEPLIRQPLYLHFDHRGRLWVVQYIQYPFPAGLTILKYDRYLRAVFNKIPPAPPNHDRGADKITILEDTNGDGIFDSHKDFLSGLNIASSVAVGRGGVWVLNPPYLLFYPDRNHDDVPDGDPEVHLSGFGLEDTHGLANSLHWGPDGWLYGAQGSTTTATINGVKFLGQAVWRYHPIEKEFELFAEGGGNTWSLSFDSKGRLFSGTNRGAARGVHYAQGGYYIKSFSKHGPLTNPFAFGFLQHMEHKGYGERFSQSLEVYEGGALPGYEGQTIAGMSLTSRMQASRLVPHASTFRTVDSEAIVLTENIWFRPLDTKVGPDGAIYISDWYDFRLSHLSPFDTWHKDSGRIYRLKSKGAAPIKPFDLSRLTSEELIKTLSHQNQWFRSQALRVLGDRRDKEVIPQLKKLVRDHQGQLALEGLWAVNASGGFDEAFALEQLAHPNEHVRTWTVRLLGDSRKISHRLQEKLIQLARTDDSAAVRSQLASSCKRLPAGSALPIIRRLLLRREDASDPHIPLLLWWAVENKLENNLDAIMEWLKDEELWRAPLFTQDIAPRLAQRYSFELGDRVFYDFSDDYQAVYSPWKSNQTPSVSQKNLAICAQLLRLAPTPDTVERLIEGMEEGLRGRVLRSVPDELQKEISKLLAGKPMSPILNSLALRTGNKNKLATALGMLSGTATSETQKRSLIGALADLRAPEAVPVFLALLRQEQSNLVKTEVLAALQHYEDPQIAAAIVECYQDLDRPLRATARGVLISRASWARSLLDSIAEGLLPAKEISVREQETMRRLGNAEIKELIASLWKEGPEKADLSATQRAFRKLGERHYDASCGNCHLASGEGMRKSLVNSKWVLGPEEILIRIALQGKQGQELMPSFASQLDDEQVASILSYIRAEWGNRADPIDASTVSSVRADTTDRARPWKEEELDRLTR